MFYFTLPAVGVNEILKLVQENHFQLACQKYFEYTHDKVSVDGGIHHPNQYFEESENVYLGHARKTRVAGKPLLIVEFMDFYLFQRN